MLQNQIPIAERQIYYSHNRAPPSYPPNTSAFLYYFRSPEKPRISGELRLRVASNNDFASFESGSDLLSLNGRPWSISLIHVSQYYIPLYTKLRQEGLVPDDLDAVLSTFPTRVRRNRCQHLYTLNDTFIVDFSIKDMFLIVITEQGMERIQLEGSFVEKRPKHRSPYTGAYTNHHPLINDSNKYVGSALARFERSTLPDQKGRRTLVLRFLKIITSAKCVIPDYDGYIVPPKEGELHRRCTSKKAIAILNPPVWSIDIDKSASLRGLQLLWDT